MVELCIIFFTFNLVKLRKFRRDKDNVFNALFANKMKDNFIVSVPLRLSLAGGGTDLPEFYLNEPTRLLAVAIDERIRIICGKDVIHQKSELTDLFKSKFPKYNVAIESNISPGAGLGGSGAISVALVAAQYHILGEEKAPLEIALEAYEWERNILGKSVGFQDQVVSAIGGCVEMRASIDGKVDADKRDDLFQSLSELMNNNFLFVETQKRHNADSILKQLANSFNNVGRKVLKPAVSVEMQDAILNKDVDEIGRVLKRHWESKKSRLPVSSSLELDGIIGKAFSCGALGAKVIGAGGGGFILLCVHTKNKDAITRSMKISGYTVKKFDLTQQGISIEKECAVDEKQ